mmetsp:Transcript_18024/g.18781  ORF Transcript_18024/g.18781 Transcript_18024/m.18781 type:complete len:290 (-) Transcript_18024:113-982(-)
MMKWAEKTTIRESRPTSLAGYLWKMKRKHKLHLPQWNKRWFSIEGKFLKWYAKEESFESSGQISLLDITSMNRFESSGGVYSFIIYSRERSLFLRADSLRTMEMWFRAIQMHADLARGGNGFTILSTATTTSPPKNRTKKHNSLLNQLERATKALTELERKVDLRQDSRCDIEPDSTSRNYYEQRESLGRDCDEVKEDPYYGRQESTSSALSTSPVYSRTRGEDLEDSTESLDSIVPVPIRKPANQFRSQQQQQNSHFFQGVKEWDNEDRDHSVGSGSGSGKGNSNAWA